MSHAAAAHHPPHGAAHIHQGHDAGGHVHSPSYYTKIYGVLVALLVVSVLGPMAEIRWLTLVTAFGIAVVKAYLVAAHFMHLNIEKKIVTYFVTVALAFMVLFYFGVAADVQKHDGQNWSNHAAKAETARALAEQAAVGSHH